MAWKDDEGNASNPQRENLILLRRGYVTHLVEVLDYKPEREKWQGDFNIYRIVEVLWVIDWNNLPNSAKADEVFGDPVKLQGGDVMFLETMPTFLATLAESRRSTRILRACSGYAQSA